MADTTEEFIRGDQTVVSKLDKDVGSGRHAPAVVPVDAEGQALAAFATVATGDVHAPAANTAAVVTYAAAGAGIAHVISGVAWSYSAAPTGGNLKIENGAGSIVFSMDITAAGPGSIPFNPPKRGSDNTAMIVTLASGAGTVVGKVSVLGHWTA